MAVAAGRTDLHTHILPGLDDGAADLEQAVSMARVALDDGITCLAATPHSLRWPPRTGRAQLATRTRALQRHLAAEGLPLKVVPGAEMALIAALPEQLEAGECVTLNGSRYLLLELPYSGLPAGLDQALAQVRAHDLVPILAHPERNDELARDSARLRRLVEEGTLVQITAGSLEGHFGRGPRRAARHFLQEGLVHVIASDAHDARGRAPRLAAAEALAARIVGTERAQAMVTATPAAILAGRELELDPPAPLRQRRRFWQRLFAP